MNHLKFPIGKTILTEYSDSTKAKYIDTISRFPRDVDVLTSILDEEELLKQYRPEGWNVRQLVHHCADSHMNAYMRFKLALTEDNPTIKPYDEAAWAELSDNLVDISFSMGILIGVHRRWTVTLESMTASDFDRTYFHPESKQSMSLWDALAMYDWHSRHHLAHIELALES